MLLWIVIKVWIPKPVVGYYATIVLRISPVWFLRGNIYLTLLARLDLNYFRCKYHHGVTGGVYIDQRWTYLTRFTWLIHPRLLQAITRLHAGDCQWMQSRTKDSGLENLVHSRLARLLVWPL